VIQLVSESLRDFVKSKYWRKGFRVVPINIHWENEKGEWKQEKPLVGEWELKKTPIVESYIQWKKKKQTEKEFDALNWKDANAYAIICGVPNHEGFYPVAIDYDAKNKMSEEAKVKGREALEVIQATVKAQWGIEEGTYEEETYSIGIHQLFLSQLPIPNDKSFHDSHGLELIGSGLCILAPSKGYKVLNDAPFTKAKSDLYRLFLRVVGVNKKEIKKKRKFSKLVIKKMLKGVKCGIRDHTANVLASY